jgi:hypothetical protein|nr:MAG TPA: hypothetical protein [Caudoviricetes sp.]
MDLQKLVNRMAEREERIKSIRSEGKKATIKLTELYYQQKIDMYKRLKEENRKNGK